jgi:hypothetical protein
MLTRRRFLGLCRLSPAIAVAALGGHAAAGATAASLAARGPLSVRDFGAIGNGTADDGRAIRAAAAALQQARQGTLLFPAGDYAVFRTGTTYTQLVDLSGCEGLRLVFEPGARFLVDPARRWRGEYGSLFRFTDCSDIRFEGALDAEGPHTPLTPPDGSGSPYGVGVARFMGSKGGKGIVLPFARIRNMAYGYLFNNGNPTPGPYTDIAIGTLEAEGVTYAISGTHVERLTAGLVRTSRIHRSYLFSHFRDHTVNVVARDPQAGDVSITCYAPTDVNSGLRLRYANRDSGAATPAAWIQLNWFGHDDRGGVFSAGRMEDIAITVDVRFNGAGGGGSLISFEKYTDAMRFPAVYDPDDRGRVLRGFSLSGLVGGSLDPAAVGLGYTNSDWGDTGRPGYTPNNADRFSGFRIHDLTIDPSVAGKMFFHFNCFTDVPVVENVHAPGTYILIQNALRNSKIRNPALPALYRNVVFEGSNWEGDRGNLSRHIYEDCTFGQTGARVLSRRNKEFRRGSRTNDQVPTTKSQR